VPALLAQGSGYAEARPPNQHRFIFRFGLPSAQTSARSHPSSAGATVPQVVP